MTIKRNRITKKQRELGFQAAREEKLAQLQDEHRSLVGTLKELGWYDRTPDLEKEKWIGRKMEEWERAQIKTPFGRFQDHRKISSEYQRHFAKYVQECCPKVFEELRELVPYFERIFGKNSHERFQVIFDQYRMEFLFDLESLFESTINHSIIKKWFLKFSTRGLGPNTFRYDYRLGENRGVLLFLRLLFGSENTVDERTRSIAEAILYLEENLKFDSGNINLPDDFDRSLIPPFIAGEAKMAIEQLLADEEKSSYLLSISKAKLTEFLKLLSNAEDVDIEAFIILQIALLDWARQHHLEKDWLIRYAYHFLTKFSESLDSPVSEVEIPLLQVRSLIGMQYEFTFPGWLPGEESRESYESRLLLAFEEELRNYFHFASNRLKLDELKRETAPRKYDRVKSLVRHVVQGWSLKKIVENDFKILDVFDSKKEHARKAKYLEEEFPKFMEFDLPYTKPAESLS